MRTIIIGMSLLIGGVFLIFALVALGMPPYYAKCLGISICILGGAIQLYGAFSIKAEHERKMMKTTYTLRTWTIRNQNGRCGKCDKPFEVNNIDFGGGMCTKCWGLSH